MFKEYLLLLLLGHVWGDFYTQTSEIAERKKNSIKWVFIHCLIYGVTNIVICVPILSIKIIELSFIATILHAGIDVVKYFYLRKKKSKFSQVFILDQILHMICLVGLSFLWTKKNIQLQELQIVNDFFEVTAISEKLFVKWLLGLLIIHKPANILIQNLIGNYKPQSNDIEIKVDHNAGRIIGTVERVLMFILLYVNQYSAIGLVLTAKSIARYDRIAKDEKFAEYYLLGTLISAGIVIVCVVFLF